MKTHRSIQLFLYCSGGESSMKCVRPALEMEINKEVQRDMVRFLVVEGAGTREINRLRSAVHGESSRSDVCHSRNLFCHSCKLVKYIHNVRR